MSSSPFPGMDPFIEANGRRADFHLNYLAPLRDQLNEILPDGFEAGSEERIYSVPDERDVRPDVTVFAVSTNHPPPGGEGRVATLERATPPEVFLRPARQVVEHFLEIRDLRGNEAEVVSVIELLSPANKREGKGMDEYLRKQRMILESATNLLEIDLLRGGQHIVCVSESSLRRRGDYAYLVTLASAQEREKVFAWRIGLREALPIVTLPLVLEVDAVALDLQAAFERCWAGSRYHRSLRYAVALEPPLSEEDAAWVAERVNSRA